MIDGSSPSSVTSIDLSSETGHYINAVAAAVSANWVLLLHDIGIEYDLDSWQGFTSTLHHGGFSTMRLDLPGHGLSEGVFSFQAGNLAVRSAMQWLKGAGAHGIFVVTVGQSIESMANFGDWMNQMRALAFVSPVGGSSSIRSLPPVPKLILVGGLDKTAKRDADECFRASTGWTVTSSFGTHEQGHDLLTGEWSRQAANQAASFFRDYAFNADPSDIKR